MRAWAAIRTTLDRLLEALVALTMAALVADVTWQVFTRFVLKDPSTWTDELATFLIVWVSLLGAAVALRRGAHLGVDVFVERIGPRWRPWVAALACLGSTAFALLVMTVGGATLVVRKLHLQETSPVLGLNLGYVYLAVPISGLFLTLYSIEQLVDRLRSRPPRAAAGPGRGEPR